VCSQDGIRYSSPVRASGRASDDGCDFYTNVDVHAYANRAVNRLFASFARGGENVEIPTAAWLSTHPRRASV
jgi:hypothetical protein